MIPIDRHAIATQALAADTPPDSPIFPFSRVHYFRLFQKYAKRAGLPEHKWHPHTLKHSVARHHIRQAGIENIRRYLGHKSLASTGEYLKVTDEEAAFALQQARMQIHDAAKS